MANQIDQNPNQFLTQPNQFSQIANRHPNQFLAIQTYIPFRVRANRLQTDAEPGPEFETLISQRLYSAMTGIIVYCLAADLTISGG